MNLTIVKSLTKGEQSLVMDTRPKKLDGLSEDELLELHNRVRRARNKYKKNYRQGAAKQVKADRSRGAASKKSGGDAQRRELFEDALARVSNRLAKAARKTADDLKAKRLAAAKKDKAAKAKAKERAAAKKKASKPAPKAAAKGKRTSKKTPASKKSVAGQRATKARKNAKKGR